MTPNTLSPHSLTTTAADHSAPDNLLRSLQDWARLQPFVSLRLLGAQTLTPETQSASGKAIITYVLAGEADFADSTGKRSRLSKGGWAWVIAGSGVGYSIAPLSGDFAAIEVCIALSPALENAPAQSTYLDSAATAPSDPVQVLIGWHDKQRSQFAIPSQVNYLVVRLNAHQRWCYELPLNHQFAWVALVSGRVYTGAGELLPQAVTRILRPTDKIDVLAQESSVLVLGSSMEFGYDLVFHEGSVHTSREALQAGLQGRNSAATLLAQTASLTGE